MVTPTVKLPGCVGVKLNDWPVVTTPAGSAKAWPFASVTVQAKA